MNIRRKMLAAMIAITCMTASSALGQQNAKKKAYTLRGKVEAVNASAGKVTVNHGKVDGWMDAMTMEYAVDKPEVLKKIKPGDQIQATVFDGDMTLHDVQPERPKK